MKLTIGTYKSKSALIKAVEKNHKVSEWAKDLINSKDFKLSEKQDIELHEITARELTGVDYPTTTEIYDAIENKGYSICPDDTALYLRMAYTDQSMDEWLVVMSNPLARSAGDLSVLAVERRSDGSWVDRDYARPGSRWDGGIRLLVCRKDSLPLEPSTLSEPFPFDSEEIRKLKALAKLLV